MIESVIYLFRSQTSSFPLGKILSRPYALAFSCLLAATICFPAFGQFKTILVNDEGATAPCVGIGPIGGPAAKKCADLLEEAGFLRSDDIGVSGLTIGTSEKDDGVITRVDAGSPAAQAGLAVGDIVLAIDGQPVKPTPGAVASRFMFGKKGEELHLKTRRNGSEREVSLVRASQAAPPNAPKSPNFFLSVKPLIDWRGKFVPCLGAGPAGVAAIAYCGSHFKPLGFIKVGERGSTGIELDPVRAVVTAIEPNSPAAKAGLEPGDEIVAVESKPLVASAGEAGARRLFGKANEQVHITVHSGDTDRTVVVTLARNSGPR